MTSDYNNFNLGGFYYFIYGNVDIECKLVNNRCCLYFYRIGNWDVFFKFECTRFLVFN